MNGHDDPDLVREARRLYRQRQASSEPTPGAGNDASPASLERTLSGISDEVTAEAIERREHAAKLLASSRGPGRPPPSRTP